MSVDVQALRTALSSIRAELAVVDARTAQMRETAQGIERLLASLEAVPSALVSESVPAPEANGAAHRRRTPLRDSIPSALRSSGGGMTLRSLTDQLWREGFVGGEEERTRIEIVRPALKALEREGVVTAETPPGEKARVWHLSNVMLVHSPRYSAVEQEAGI